MIAIGDRQIVDVAPVYAKDMEATLAARDLTPRQLRRSLGWARLVCACAPPA